MSVPGVPMSVCVFNVDGAPINSIATSSKYNSDATGVRVFFVQMLLICFSSSVNNHVSLAHMSHENSIGFGHTVYDGQFWLYEFNYTTKAFVPSLIRDSFVHFTYARITKIRYKPQVNVVMTKIKHYWIDLYPERYFVNNRITPLIL